MSDEEPEPVSAEKESILLYRRLRQLFSDGGSRRRRIRRTRDSDSVPYGSGRDPAGLGSVVDSLAEDMGWTAPLARSEVLLAWPDLVGEELAAHSSPIAVDDKVLTIRCDSTAWATQLRMIRSVLLAELADRYPDSGVEGVRVLGPDVPSWKRGPRSIPGRGPRDTYG